MQTSVIIKTDTAAFGKQALPNIYILRKVCAGYLKKYNLTPDQLIKAVEVCPRCKNKQKIITRKIRQNTSNGTRLRSEKTNCDSCNGLGFVINASKF